MNNFEFWKDMDKIFDAIVAYQEKNIEFNKRFINPWVNLGNVFDKKENNETIAAHKNAVEIDPENAQNWYELAGTYTRSGDFDESIKAYQKAIELGYESGDLFKNMALGYAMTARHQEAIPVFEKALELSENDKEKAVVWNHLGNVYRNLNNYELAIQAFQNADQLEGTISSKSEQQTSVKFVEENPQFSNVQGEEVGASQSNVEPVTVLEEDSLPDEPETPIDYLDLEEELTASTGDEVDPSITDEYEPLEEEGINVDEDLPVIFEMDFAEETLEEGNLEEQSIPEPISAAEDMDEPTILEAQQQEDLETEDVSLEYESIAVPISGLEKYEAPTSVEVDQKEAVEPDLTTTFSAYEEYLNDNNKPVNTNMAKSQSKAEHTIAMASDKVDVTDSEMKMDDVSTDMTIDMDTKNAHVWNELGNVYFNAGAFDDAIAAYTKAIELDKQFAWSYTNLAMAFVEKGRLKEAILLYQRSIELFSNEKDKAVTWNRLGNLYRRLDDYGNAIAAYQRADDLDPGNTAITNPTKFSLLGSEKIDQEVGYSL